MDYTELDRLFMEAVKAGDISQMILLYSNGCDINTFNNLYIAAEKNNLQVVKMLINMGIYTNDVDQFLIPNIMNLNHIDIFEYLIKHLATIYPNSINMYMRFAIINSNKSLIRYLIDHGANIHIDPLIESYIANIMNS